MFRVDFLSDWQVWFWLISLLSKGLSRVFSSPSVWKHQLFSAHSSLWSNSHIHTWLLENHSTTECHFCFESAVSFFLKLLVVALCSSSVAYWTPSKLVGSYSGSYNFAFAYCLEGPYNKNTGVVHHFLFQWTMFCHNSSVRAVSWVALRGRARSFI